VSNKERLVQLAADTPENLASFAFFLLKHYLDAAEDAADDTFCRHLIEEALADPGKDDWVDFDDACQLLGVQLR
jgi:hypothetical protein